MAESFFEAKQNRIINCYINITEMYLQPSEINHLRIKIIFNVIPPSSFFPFVFKLNFKLVGWRYPPLLKSWRPLNQIMYCRTGNYIHIFPPTRNQSLILNLYKRKHKGKVSLGKNLIFYVFILFRHNYKNAYIYFYILK